MRYCTLTERIKMVCYALQMGWEPTKKNGNPWICELAVKKVSIQAGFSKPLHGEPGRFIKDLYNRMDMGVLHEDNTACIKLSRNCCCHDRTKHVDYRAHLLRS